MHIARYCVWVCLNIQIKLVMLLIIFIACLKQHSINKLILFGLLWNVSTIKMHMALSISKPLWPISGILKGVLLKSCNFSLARSLRPTKVINFYSLSAALLSFFSRIISNKPTVIRCNCSIKKSPSDWFIRTIQFENSA